MTGIDRLRKVSEQARKRGCPVEHCPDVPCKDCWGIMLADIADQIEREQGSHVSRTHVLSVITDMERHVLGHEGMEDSPVARWARELREALGGRDEEEVTDVATIRKDAMEAYEWVCENGGLDAVKRRWECLSYYVDPVPRACMEKRLARLQRQIDESHAALRRRNERIAELEARLNDFQKTQKVGVSLTSHSDESPAPKVLDADGAEIRVKETVFDKNTGEGLIVTGFEDGRVWCEHRMTDANALPVRGMWSPDQLTHERPESKCRDCAHWQKDPTADNMGVCWFLYHEHEGQDCYAARRADIGACEEFVRRAKKLAGVGE